MRNKIFTSVPFVDRERWQHSGKSIICSLLPSKPLPSQFSAYIFILCAQKAPHSTHYISNNTIQSHFFTFLFFFLTSTLFFLSLILPPTAIMPVSRFSLISIADIFAADFEPFSFILNRPRAKKYLLVLLRYNEFSALEKQF